MALTRSLPPSRSAGSAADAPVAFDGARHDGPADQSGSGSVDAVRLRSLLTGAAQTWSIESVDSTGSTNADLLARLGAARVPGTDALPPGWNPMVRTAAVQSAGRGRRGRSWVAAPGDALLFSLAYPMPRPLSGLSGLSLAIGAAVLRGLRALPLDGAHRLALKWPNDVLLDGGKLAGILVETASHSRDACALVIGIGINLRNSPALAQPPTEAASDGLAPAPRALTPAALSVALPSSDTMPQLATDALAHVLNALAETLAQFATGGFAACREEWRAAHAYEGQMVSLFDAGRETLRGRVAGIDDAGRLLVDTGAGPQVVASGEISMRAAPPAAPAEVAAPRRDGRDA